MKDAMKKPVVLITGALTGIGRATPSPSPVRHVSMFLAEEAAGV